jgi:glycosyltransferase involved in cell wall biosynthesis
MGRSVFKSSLISTFHAGELSVVVITLNEESNLPGLLRDIPKGAEIIIVDSASIDRTVAIAQSFGASVSTRAFDNYASQKNHAIALATRPWVLCLDADERPDAELWRSIEEALSAKDSGERAYSLSRRLVFLGRRMRFGRTKDQLVRLFKASSAVYTNEIHESLRVRDGVAITALGGTLWHHSYENLDDYFARFNRYTSLMAANRLKRKVKSPPALLLAARLPVDFGARYILRLGFLDGWQGFLWALFGSFYGFVKYAKLREGYRGGRVKE